MRGIADRRRDGHPPRTPAAAGGGQRRRAGLAGVAAMTTAEKVEQACTARPSSYVPGRTLETLLGGHPGHDEAPLLWNHAMHWGTGAVLGALRGVWAALGLRGPRAHVAHTVLPLCADQTLENATGVGAPARTWPRREEVIDVTHEAVYAVITGLVAERLVHPRLQSGQGRHQPLRSMPATSLTPWRAPPSCSCRARRACARQPS